jgi:hypothetical protein
VKLRDSRTGDDIFEFANLLFNNSAILEGILSGEVPHGRQMAPIVKWAEKYQLLDRKKPDARRQSSYIRINHDYLWKITEKRMKEPAIIAETEYGWIFIDGNHRVGRAYLDGLDEFDSYTLDKETVNAILKDNQW